MMNQFNPILAFWFEGLNDQSVIQDSPAAKKWFKKDFKFDAEIKERFEEEIINASCGKYREWEASMRGRLALIILFDQFSRNIYRNSPRAFESDPLALNLTLRSLKERTDKDLSLIERTFLYMPLMHSENFTDQEFSVKYFGDLVGDSRAVSPQNVPYYEYSLDYARRHRDIIKQFGRFPHRNQILRRPSTKEELAFLEMPGSSF